ncbi:MAG: discoidin domain-containing protein, partial [Patescibacteria group bacterium]
YEATWFLGVPQSILGLIKAHAFIYYIDWRIFGWNPWGWYLTSLAFHLVASMLFYKLVLLISKNKLFSLLSSLIFVASTSYNDVLTWGSFNSYYPLLLTWMLASLIAFIKYKETNRKIFQAISVGLVFVGFYIRETGLVIVPILTLFDIIFSKNIKNRKTIVELVKRQTPFYVALVAFFLIRSIYGGTPGDSADSNVKLQMRFVEDGLYWEYAKTSFLTMGKLIPPQIIPYPFLNSIRDLISQFVNLKVVNTYFFPLLGWSTLGMLGAVWFRIRKSNYSAIFLFSLMWLGIFSIFVALVLPNTPEVLSRAYEYNTMRYRYFAFAGMSVILASIIVMFLKKGKKIVFFTTALVLLNLTLIWKLEKDIYATSYEPAKNFYMRLTSVFPSFPDKAVFYLYPHASGLSDYFLEWYLIKGDTYSNLKDEPYRIESQIIAVLNKLKKGEIKLSDVFFLDLDQNKRLLNETDRARNLLLNQRNYQVNLTKTEEATYKSEILDGPLIDIPYSIIFDLNLSEKSQFRGKSPDSKRFRALVDYSVGRNDYLRTVSISTAYTMSQREGEPFYHVLPKNLIDGNTGVRYSWIADSWEPWVQADLGKEQEVIAVAWGSLEGSTRVPATYSISVSRDGERWIKVKEVKKAENSQSIDRFDKPYLARFVKMEIDTTSGGDFVFLDEFEVIPYSSERILSYYNDRNKLLNDSYNMFIFAEGEEDLLYMRNIGLETYWGKLSWGTNDSTEGSNNQVFYFPYSIQRPFQNLTLEIHEGEVFSVSGNFLKKYINSITLEYGDAPFNFNVDSLQFSPRFKL